MSERTTFIFVRHGETDWNREGRWQGQADIPLNAVGRAQAERMAGELAGRYHLNAIYASDLSRAYETALALSKASGAPVYTDPRLREVDHGQWEGMRAADIRVAYADIYQRRTLDPWSVPSPGGETATQVRERMTAALRDIAARHPGGTVAVVAHAFVLAVARVHVTGEPRERLWDLIPENCAPVQVDWKGAG